MRCRTPGMHPDEFGQRLNHSGAPGQCGQFVVWDQPCTYVDRFYETLLMLAGSSLDMCWVAGDGNAPRHWNGAANTANVLTLVGAPTAEVAPYQLAGGQDVALEAHTGASYRANTDARVLTAGHDEVLIVWGRMPTAGAAGERLFSSVDPATGQGVELYLAASNQLTAAARTNGGAAGTSTPAAGHVSPAAIFIAAVLYDRTADTVTLWTPGATGAAGGVTDGVLTDDGIGIGAGTGGANPIGAGAGIFGVARLRGAGIAPPWAADTYYRFRELRHRLSGTWPRQGGMPVWTRATARSRPDRNGRWWIYSSGMPAAGDSNDLRLASARTNKAYRTVGIPAGALAEWIGDDGSTATGAADAAALAAAGLADLIGTNVATYANASGASRYLRNGAATGGTTRHALSVFARIVAGAGAEIGWWSTTTGAFTAVGAVSDAYVRTEFGDLVPPDATSYLCIHVPNGCTLYWGGQQCEGSGSATQCAVTSQIPNWSAVGTAARNAETSDTTITPDNAQGSVSIDVTPIWWSGVLGPNGTSVVTRAGGADPMLTSGGAADVWYTYDGTALVTGGNPTAGSRDVIRVRYNSIGQRLDINGTRTQGAYDGTRGGAGVMRLQCSEAEIAVRNFRIYRNGSG